MSEELNYPATGSPSSSPSILSLAHQIACFLLVVLPVIIDDDVLVFAAHKTLIHRLSPAHEMHGVVSLSFSLASSDRTFDKRGSRLTYLPSSASP